MKDFEEGRYLISALGLKKSERVKEKEMTFIPNVKIVMKILKIIASVSFQSASITPAPASEWG